MRRPGGDVRRAGPHFPKFHTVAKRRFQGFGTSMGLVMGTPSGCSDRGMVLIAQVLDRRSWSWRLLSITYEKAARKHPILAPENPPRRRRQTYREIMRMPP